MEESFLFCEKDLIIVNVFVISALCMMSEKEFYNAFGFNTGSFLLTRESKAF